MMVCKNSLVLGLSFKLRIGLAFVKKVSKARKTLRDNESLIRGKILAETLARIVDQGALAVENVFGVGKILEKAFGS